MSMNGSFYLHDILSYDSGNATKSCFWSAKLKVFTINMRRWYGCHFITFGTKELKLIGLYINIYHMTSRLG